MCTVRAHAGPSDCFPGHARPPMGMFVRVVVSFGAVYVVYITVILIGTEPQLILHSGHLSGDSEGDHEAAEHHG